MRGIEKRLTSIEKKIAERRQAAKELPPLRIIWVDTQAGPPREAPKPGTWIIYWGAGDEIGTYRYNPDKPNGGRPEPKSKGG